jgi:hypothetical protein
VLDHILHADDPARDLLAHLGHRRGQPTDRTWRHPRRIPHRHGSPAVKP